MLTYFLFYIKITNSLIPLWGGVGSCISDESVMQMLVIAVNWISNQLQCVWYFQRAAKNNHICCLKFQSVYWMFVFCVHSSWWRRRKSYIVSLRYLNMAGQLLLDWGLVGWEREESIFLMKNNNFYELMCSRLGDLGGTDWAGVERERGRRSNVSTEEQHTSLLSCPLCSASTLKP